MRWMILACVLVAAGCTDRLPPNGRNSRTRATMQIDPDKQKRSMEAMRAAYVESVTRTDRIFGETFQDVSWGGMAGKTLIRASTGDAFDYTDYNGGYPSFLSLMHSGQSLEADVKRLGLLELPREPIFVVSPPKVISPRGAPHSPDWSQEERQLIASFIQSYFDNERYRRRTKPPLRTSVVFEA